MRKGRSLRILSIIALLVAIAGLIISYAAISDSLKGKEDSCLWNIQIHDLKAEKMGQAVYHLPVVSETSLQNFSAQLRAPGDAVHLEFQVENKGTMDALLATFWRSKPSCRIEGEGDRSICEKLEYHLQYKDGTDVAINDLLNPNSSKVMQFSVVYPTNASPLTQGKVILDDLTIFMIYQQNV